MQLTSNSPIEAESASPGFPSAFAGDVDRSEIADWLRLTPLERLRRLDHYVEFVNRYTSADAKLLRDRHRDARNG
jgi:hypothetical protein